MMSASFELPAWIDLGAVFAFALTGALAAINRGYDIVGIRWDADRGANLVLFQKTLATSGFVEEW